MSRLANTIGVSLALVMFLSLCAPTGNGAVHGLVEDFTTTRYKNPVNTTAWWDTLAGELKLFPFVPAIVGAYDTPGTAWAVAVSGDFAYVGDYASGLQVVDISDPTHPELVATCDTPMRVLAVVVAGDHVYAGDGTSGLQVIDVGDPAAPVIVGSCDTPGTAYDVAVSGDYLYLADYAYGLQVIDISDPTAPTLAGTYDTPGTAFGVAVWGDYAYVADGASGLQVIDISDPTTPLLAGTCDTPGSAWQVAIAGEHAFVGDVLSGLRIVDISDPASPALVGGYDTPGAARGLCLAGDRAYVADATYGIKEFDISDPAAPTLVKTCDTPDSAYDVVVAGEHAFVADFGSGLQVIDIRDPTDLALRGTLDQNGLRGLAVAGDYVYVTNESSLDVGLQVVDITDVAHPTGVANCALAVAAHEVAVAGDRLFLANDAAGLTVFDVSDPGAPALVGSCDTPGTAEDICVAGDLAFVADGNSGLQVIDISDPTAPALVGACDTPGNGGAVALWGDYAFVADGPAGLQVIDISDPATPTLVGTYNTPSSAQHVAFSGAHALVADLLDGLLVIDVSDPAHPALKGACETPGDAYGVAVSGDYAFVADGAGGLHEIDISDLAAPTLTKTCESTMSSATRIIAAGDHAFLVDHFGGLKVIQLFQGEIEMGRNVGQSLPIDLLDGTYLQALITSTQTDLVTWELSVDGGASWQGFEFGGRLFSTAQTSSLLWRSTHTWAEPGINPTASRLELEWYYRIPVIEAIADIGNDQGRQVRIEWLRSAHDFYPVAPQVVEYAIYRRIDPLALAAAREPATVALAGAEAGGTAEEVAAALAAGWDYVTTVPAETAEKYSVVVPTLADSTIADGQHWSVFLVRARTATPGVFYDSHPDSGYSVDNLAPAMPGGFLVDYASAGNELAWKECPDDDFRYFRIYRGTTPDFAPDSESLVYQTIGTGWVDAIADPWLYHYKVSALDFAGNESLAAAPGAVTGVDASGAPARLALLGNTPNPFNPLTTIAFSLPRTQRVKLTVFDLAGRPIRVLVAEERPVGRHEVQWNGTDSHGQNVPSGVYVCRLEAGSFRETRSMTLVK